MTCLADWEVAPTGTVARLERVEAAARSVIERWDSPLWKYTEPTADIINRLRAALDGTP